MSCPLISNALDLPQVYGAVPAYSDVAENKWYCKTIASAKQTGILNGLANGGVFRPDEPITRQDMALILANTADAQNVKLNHIADASKFKDYRQISADRTAAVEKAINAGLLSANGMGNGDFAPMQYTTRAQVAVIQLNLLGVLGNLD